MKKINDMFEAMGPNDIEKQQILNKLLDTKVKKPVNWRPLGIAAALFLMAAVSVPLLTQWQPTISDSGNDPGNDPAHGAIITGEPAASVMPSEPAASEPAATPKPASKEVVLLSEMTMDFEADESIKVEATYQDIILVLTDEQSLTVRQYDYGDVKPFDLNKINGTVEIKAKKASSVNRTGSIGTPRFEIRLPRRGSLDFGIGNVILSATSGDIQVETGPDLESNVGLSVKGELVFTTSSGNIETQCSLAANNVIFLNTTSGNIRVDRMIAGKDIFMTSSSGKIRAGHLKADGNIVSYSASGGVQADYLYAGGDITVNSTSGGARIERISGTDVSVTSTSGAIDIGVLISARYLVESNSGKVTIVDIQAGERRGSPAPSIPPIPSGTPPDFPLPSIPSMPDDALLDVKEWLTIIEKYYEDWEEAFDRWYEEWEEASDSYYGDWEESFNSWYKDWEKSFDSWSDTWEEAAGSWSETWDKNGNSEWNNKKYRPATGEIVLRQELNVSLQGVEAINISSLYQNISVTLTNADTLSFRLYDFDDAELFTLDANGKTVSIKSVTQSFEPGGYSTSDVRIEIGIPRSYRGEVNLGSVSGNIVTEGSINWKKAILGTVSGNITLNTIEAQEVNLATVSGNIKAGAILGGTYNASSVSGNIEIKEVTSKGSAATLNGTVTVNGKTIDSWKQWSNW